MFPLLCSASLIHFIMEILCFLKSFIKYFHIFSRFQTAFTSVFYIVSSSHYYMYQFIIPVIYLSEFRLHVYRRTYRLKRSFKAFQIFPYPYSSKCDNQHNFQQLVKHSRFNGGDCWLALVLVISPRIINSFYFLFFVDFREGYCLR